MTETLQERGRKATFSSQKVSRTLILPHSHRDFLAKELVSSSGSSNPWPHWSQPCITSPFRACKKANDSTEMGGRHLGCLTPPPTYPDPKTQHSTSRQRVCSESPYATGRQRQFLESIGIFVILSRRSADGEMGTGITTQWALDRTASGAFTVSRGFLEAATTDNVQTTALLACEAFGTTVAMSPESCTKAEILCSQTGQSAMLPFVKAQIGYREGDSGWYLSRNHAGLRFLGLAAALTTIDPWAAARVLYTRIDESAADKRLVPSTLQLKQLLLVLESRLAKAGFANNVLGWSQVFMDVIRRSGDVIHLDVEKHGVVTPSVETISALVEGIAATSRVGEDAQRLEIHTTAAQAAWIVAFVKWCTGAPPLIVLHDGDILGQPGETAPSIMLRLLRNTGKSKLTRIETYDPVGKLKRLVTSAEGLSSTKGLVSVGAYGEAVLRQRFGTNNDVKYRACVGALPHACALVREKLMIKKTTSSPQNIFHDFEYLGSDTTATMGQAFPSVSKISQTLQDYLRTGDRPLPVLPELTALQVAPPIEDLPLWAMLRLKMAKDCPCRTCQPMATRKTATCTYNTLIHDFSTTVSNILLLSLIRPLDPNGVQVYFGCAISGTFVSAVKLVLFGETARGRSPSLPTSCTIWDTLQPAVAMLGHEFGDSGAWVMSSCYGQTVFPSMFASTVLEPEGVLSLECMPGLIYKKRSDGKKDKESEPYTLAQVSPSVQFMDFSDDESDDDANSREEGNSSRHSTAPAKLSGPVLPKNLYSDAIQWNVQSGESNISISLTAPQLPGLPIRNPMFAVEAAAGSVFVYCSHDRMAPYSGAATLAPFEVTPWDPRWPGHLQSFGIVQCDRNEPMRLFSLTAGRPAVIRMDACLECCSKCCALTGIGSVIC